MATRKNQKKTLVPEVRSLGELYQKAQTDPQYKKLLVTAAQNLGGSATTAEQAYRHLQNEAMESGSEEGVVDEVNFCRDII